MGTSTFMKLEIESLSENESFARVVVAAFAARLDPTLEEISDIKTAVSEAVTNAIIHAYEDRVGLISVRAYIDGNVLTVEVEDWGVGIEDVEKARQPLYTSKPELERSGMGFTIMENFMDKLTVRSAPGQGTLVTMVKEIRSKSRVKEY
ncbi:MAG: anti-sigma F factor [Firmicutes bacterium]|jgi:stage II sporulation protein AB (anti-sigma F factor)|nr:anti-sigma F factor [Bacillota bacterium]